MLGRDLLPLPELNRAIGLQLNGRAEAYPTASDCHPLAGRPFPEASVQRKEGLQRVATLLTPAEFVLLDLTGHNLFPADLPGVRVVHGSLSAPTPQLVGLRAALLRPDGYVLWASDGHSPDVNAAVDRCSSSWRYERRQGNLRRPRGLIDMTRAVHPPAVFVTPTVTDRAG